MKSMSNIMTDQKLWKNTWMPWEMSHEKWCMCCTTSQCRYTLLDEIHLLYQERVVAVQFRDQYLSNAFLRFSRFSSEPFFAQIRSFQYNGGPIKFLHLWTYVHAGVPERERGSGTVRVWILNMWRLGVRVGQAANRGDDTVCFLPSEALSEISNNSYLP